MQAQEALCQQYCADHDYDVVGVYADEGKSASKALDKRTELLRLISDAEKGKVSVILFKDITRWTRNAAAYYKVQERLDKCGCAWIAVEQPYLETVTPTGRFQVQVMIGTAQLVLPVYGVGRTAVVLEGIFQGVGDTLYPFVSNMLAMWGVRVLGTAITVRTLGFGLPAAWGCMIAHNILLFIMYLCRYRSGKWNPLLTGDKF